MVQVNVTHTVFVNQLHLLILGSIAVNLFPTMQEEVMGQEVVHKKVVVLEFHRIDVYIFCTC